MEEKGYSVFFDEDELRGTADWEGKLEEGLKDNDKVIFFITPHSARRPDGYCLNELAMALTYKRNIVPVMLAYEVPPLSIIRQQYLDMRSCFREDDLDEVLFERHIENLLQVLEGNKELDFEGAQARLFEALNPLDTTADFAKHKHIVGREWIIGEIDNWVEEYPDSKVLWITAEAGYGKSALAAYLANNHPQVAGIHFCNYNRPNTKDAKQVVKTLAYHLQARQLDGYFDTIKYVDTKDKNAVELFNDLIANPLNRSQYNEENNLLIVIDALDETLDDTEEELIDLIGSDEFKVGLPDFVKFIVISRPDARLEETFSGLNTIELNVQQKKNEEDCIEFINFRLGQLKQNKYKIDAGFIDTVLNDEKIINSIVENSGANMLYLNKFFEEVEKRNIDLSEPDTFPKGLNGIYKGFFKRITTDKEKYDDVYAPILEVILSYGKPISRLLLSDILGMDLKPFNRAVNDLGTMIKEDDGDIDVYHKSLKDWLVSDTNKTYFVDIKDGKRKIHTFIEALTKENYKEEYLYFKYFNIILIDAIYDKERRLNSFFHLLSNTEQYDERFLSCISDWGYNYILRNQTEKAIVLLEKHKSILHVMKENLLGSYISSLHTLSYVYHKVNRSNEAIDLLREAYDLIKPLYHEDNETWVEEYVRILNSIASTYKKVENYKKAILFEEESLDILKNVSNKFDSTILTEQYIAVLNNLGFSFKKTNQIDKAHLLYLEAYEIIKPYFLDDKQNMRMALYVTILSNLASSYQVKGFSKDAIRLNKESIERLKPFFKNCQECWVEEYTRALTNLGTSYVKINEKTKGIELFAQSLKILEPFYQSNEPLWIDEYINLLNNLAHTYNKMGENVKSHQLYDIGIKSIQPFYKENNDRWANRYLNIKYNFALLLAKKNLAHKAIEQLLECYNIQKSFYEKNPSRWEREFLDILISLGSLYIQEGNIQRGIMFLQESLDIVLTLYTLEPKNWEDVYIKTVNTLLYVYRETNQYDFYMKLDKEAKEKFKKNNPISPVSVSKDLLGRNDPCPCKSGKKYKKCCGKN